MLASGQKLSYERAAALNEAFPEIDIDELTKLMKGVESYNLHEGYNPSVELTFWNGNGCIVQRHYLDSEDAQDICYTVNSFTKDGQLENFSEIHEVILRDEYELQNHFCQAVTDTVKDAYEIGTTSIAVQQFLDEYSEFQGTFSNPNATLSINDLEEFVKQQGRDILAINSGLIDVENCSLDESGNGIVVMFENGRGVQLSFETDDTGYVASDIKAEQFIVAEELLFKTAEGFEEIETTSLDKIGNFVVEVSLMEEISEADISAAMIERDQLLEDSKFELEM